MSQRFRQRRGIGKASAPPGALVLANDGDTSVQDDAPLQSGIHQNYYDSAFPGPTAVIHTNADGYQPAWPAGIGTAYHDNIDHEIGGVPGQVDNTPYTMGVVESGMMEDFRLTGQQAVIRRPRNPSDRGPVGTADHNTLVGLALAQSANMFWPNEASQADVVRSV